MNGVYLQLARGISDQIDSIPSDQRLHVGMSTHNEHALVYCVEKGKRSLRWQTCTELNNTACGHLDLQMFLLPERDNDFGHTIEGFFPIGESLLIILAFDVSASMYQHQEEICISCGANTSLHAWSGKGHREEEVTIGRVFEKPHFYHFPRSLCTQHQFSSASFHRHCINIISSICTNFIRL